MLSTLHGLHPIEGQPCIVNTDVQHNGHDEMTRNRLGICPQLDFRCNARITRIRVRAHRDSHRHDFPYIQVWRPLSEQSTIYHKIAQILVNSSHIVDLTFTEANISLTGRNRIHVQSGDAIGYLHPNDAAYKVRSLQTRGYELFQFIGYAPTVTTIDLNKADKRYTPRQPLFSFEIGKCVVSLLVVVLTVLKCH